MTTPIPQESVQFFRLSPQQKRLLTLQSDSHGTSYQARCDIQIEGNLDKERLQRAIDIVVERNEILRTRLREFPEMKFPVQVIDDARRILIRDGGAPPEVADSSGRPLMDLVLANVAAKRHILHVTLPAIFSDLLGLEHLVKKIGSAYAGEEEPSEDQLQYADYSEWQNETLESEETEEGREYWRELDISIDRTGKLLFEKEGSEGDRFDPRTVCGPSIDSPLVEKMEDLARRYGSSLTCLLQSCWQVLLWRLTGQRDLVIGTAIDGRIYEELEDNLGLFTRFLPIRCRLDENRKMEQILEETRNDLKELSEWQFYFSWKLLGQAEKKSSNPPFFTYCFEHSRAAERYQAEGVVFVGRRRYACIDRFGLKLSSHLSEDSLLTEFQYDAKRFEKADIERIAGYFQHLLRDVLDRPEVAIGALEIVDEAESRELWLASHESGNETPRDVTLSRIFEEQVELTPHRPAVVFEEQTLSYDFLTTRANQFAHHFQTLGIGPESRVGVCLGRSPLVIAVVLGVLKAGGAYVPLNPAYPRNLLRSMLEDSEAALLIKDRQSPDLSETRIRVMDLDVEGAVVKSASRENPTHQASPMNLAYVIYTSGSSGRPKGVAVKHRSVVNLVLALRSSIYRPLAGRRLDISVNGPLAFDTSVKQMVQVLEGHTLHILADELRFDPQRLVTYLRERQINVFDCTPTLLQLLMDERQSTGFDSLPLHVLLGGEAIGSALWQSLVRTNKVRFYNLYGPTECTVDSTLCEVSSDVTRPHIGRPVMNVGVYLLDRYLRPVPRGVIGEIFIAGAGLARGYLKQPGETAARFLPHLKSTEAGGRIYRSGDMARRLPGGELEFLGRRDHQVKIRGFRIEPAEIEAALERQPTVTMAIVVPREKAAGEERLVAYLVAGNAVDPTGESLRSWRAELRDALLSELPDFMIPAAFEALEKLPRTPNGKVDRRALPEPDWAELDAPQGFVAPRNRAERVLARSWSQILGVEKVGAQDNFFALGGDSIQSIRAIAKAGQEGVRLSLPQFFEYDTLAELAAVAELAPTTLAEQGLVTGPVPLTPIQHWFFEQGFDDPHEWNQTLVLDMREALDPAILRQTVSRLFLHHDMLRARFSDRGPVTEQRITGPDEPLPFLHIDFSTLGLAEKRKAMAFAGNTLRAAPDIWHGPIVQFAFLDPGEGAPGQLAISPHALVVDGFSWRILLEDLEAVYQGLERGEVVELPPKTLSLKSWSEQLLAHAESGSVVEERDFWLAEPRTSITRLPVDPPEEPKRPTSTGTFLVGLDESETRALTQELTSAHHVQIDEILLTALGLSFTSWMGGGRLLVDVRTHGREWVFEDADVSRTVGWFTAIFPLALELEEMEGPTAALKAVKERLRGIPNRGLGYGLLRYLHSDENLARRLQELPQAEVSFNYLGRFDQTFQGSSLFTLTEIDSGLERGLWARRYLVEVQGGIVNGKLQLIWKYDAKTHRRATMEDVAQEFLSLLRSQISLCREGEESYTPSDFPAAKLGQEELDDFLASIEGTFEEEST